MNEAQTILLVEDDTVDVLTMKRAWRELGIKNPLHVERDGAAALFFLQSHENSLPAIILLDLNMPRMNGLEFLEEKNKIDHIRPIPTILLTTSKQEADRLAGFKLGICGYMIKPLDFLEFLDMIARIRDYWTQSMLPYS